jgi:hypothetical protein
MAVRAQVERLVRLEEDGQELATRETRSLSG